MHAILPLCGMIIHTASTRPALIFMLLSWPSLLRVDCVNISSTRKVDSCMNFSGTQTIAAPIDKVWAFLLDVNNVAACAPGFQSLEELDEEHWKAVVAVGIGSIKAKF